MQASTLLQTDNHTSTPPLSFLQAGCPSCRPTNSVKALKEKAQIENKVKLINYYYFYYYTCLMVSFPGQPGQASTRKVKPVWI